MAPLPRLSIPEYQIKNWDKEDLVGSEAEIKSGLNGNLVSEVKGIIVAIGQAESSAGHIYISFLCQDGSLNNNWPFAKEAFFDGNPTRKRILEVY